MLVAIIAAAAIGMVVGFAFAAVTLAVRVYNTLTSGEQAAINAFSQIEVQLKRRHDLIPNLVESTRSYLSHERETLEAVIRARQQASANLDGASGAAKRPADLRSIAVSESALGGALGRLSMVIESYPDLKANETVARLMEELTSSENRIGFARQLFNDLVTQFNVARRRFPAVLIAGTVGFSADMETLQFDDEPQIHDAPVVNLAEPVLVS